MKKKTHCPVCWDGGFAGPCGQCGGEGPGCCPGFWSRETCWRCELGEAKHEECITASIERAERQRVKRVTRALLRLLRRGKASLPSETVVVAVGPLCGGCGNCHYCCYGQA